MRAAFLSSAIARLNTKRLIGGEYASVPGIISLHPTRRQRSCVRPGGEEAVHASYSLVQ
jgi:hypothetical protein